MNNKTILISGINGFIGKHLFEMLSDKFPTAKIVGADITETTVQCKSFIVDLCSFDRVLQLIESISPDYIFHLAGIINSRDWDELYRANVVTTHTLIETVKKTIHC